jgi:DNA-binding Lrp family transcriptional regulator
LRLKGFDLGEQIKIDEIDAKILKILLLESRTSFTVIAKECEISVGAVRMRYKQLWKKGVINGEKMLVNPHCLGYRHIVDLGIINAVENDKEVAKFLESKPYMSELVSPLGKYNFDGKVALRDLNKLHQIIEDLESNHNIQHVDALIWAEAVNIEHPQNLIIKPLNHENEPKINYTPSLTNLDQAPLVIDERDRKIAKILSENSRTPFRKIGAQLDISTKAVIQRYKKLRENLLTLSTVTLDLTKLGYNANASIYLKVSNRSKMPEIYSQLLQIPNLIVLIRLTGSYDLYCAVALEDFEKMFETNEKIRRISGVNSADTFITKMPPSWPLNLFPSLLEKEYIQPKYWPQN